MTVPGGARAAEGTAMPSGRLGWGREPPPRSEPRSRAARTAPRAPPPLPSAPVCPVREGNDHVSTPSPRGGSEVSQRGPQANGVRRAPPACTPAPSHCRVHACVCACAIGGMGPWARCEGGW